MSRPYNPSYYQGAPELQSRMKRSKVPARAVGAILGYPASTLRSKLNGDSALFPEERSLIEKAIEQAEADIAAAEGAKA
jgi:hypothetical protein